MIIVVKDAGNPTEELKELAIIMAKLRAATIKWQTYYGASNRERMKYWETKADDWIKEHITND